MMQNIDQVVKHTKLCGQLYYLSQGLAELEPLMELSCATCSWSAGVLAQHVAQASSRRPSVPEWLGWLQS